MWKNKKEVISEVMDASIMGLIVRKSGQSSHSGTKKRAHSHAQAQQGRRAEVTYDENQRAHGRSDTREVEKESCCAMNMIMQHTR